MSLDNPLLGIIGTAGRKDDANKLNIILWNTVKGLVLKFIEEHGITYLISGGSAYADSLVPEAYMSNKVKQIGKIVLCLPCEFNLNDGCFKDTGEKDFVRNAGGTLNFYHRQYSKVLGRKSLDILRNAILREKTTEVIIGNGLFDRNSIVADKADMILALTFGEKEYIKDGGTADTVKKFVKKNGNEQVYHLNLNDLTIYKNAKTL